MAPLAAKSLAALTLVGLATMAQTAPPHGKPTPWTTGTAPPPAPPPADESTLALRIYRDGQPPLPYWPMPGTPGALSKDSLGWATDVSAVMTRCADGNLVITALVIGGRLTPLDARCPGEPREGTSAPAQPACDARTWNCTTDPAR